MGFNNKFISDIELMIFQNGFLKRIGDESSRLAINRSSEVLTVFYHFLDKENISINEFEPFSVRKVYKLKKELKKYLKWYNHCVDYNVIVNFIKVYKKQYP